ncbi:PIR Superfamily Protein [Plasmodium ovale wallikeri]|uniref:PIR Superfamily Protein n=1 Tax=Plasmodium ovale wallikeri TaxID=864142 RepID=A0A1A9ANS4_PLAOA|nr:PIR Superfamily Protein [Plasmodium ovale wallikeri]SBT57743.1 PIR Superfamily Protein [Plasmodium ovale wallikeri]
MQILLRAEKFCAELYNTNVVKCYSYHTKNFCTELDNFNKKYLSENSSHLCSNSPQLTPFPKTTEEVQLPKYHASINQADQESHDGFHHSTNNNKPFIIYTILCFTPLGSCLRLLNKRKNNIYDSLTEEQLNILPNSSREQ